MTDKRPRTPREAAAFSLFAMMEDGAWSDGALHHYLGRAGLDSRDAALASRLVYGTVQKDRAAGARVPAHGAVPADFDG